MNKTRRLIFALAMAMTLSLSGRSFGQACCPEKTEQKKEILWRRLETQIKAVDKSFHGVLGVAVLDLTDGKTLLVNGDEVFPQASSIKIAILAELYRQE